ncbi:hypothetical protein SASPL_117876 [Salvia splendens]|uniref:Malectin-like domain-containing protein n=1 Tax=Salvia splendens TaxID=180675 RepID=A0A8X8Y0A8_SALSN|nr:hypothetical protein SASPL_117876 [Salvia splendens]
MAAFTPANNYLLACGSSQNVIFLGQTYVPDSVPSSSVALKSRGDSFVVSSNSTAPFPIYQSARVFRSTASYRFDIKRQGRHWVRLHFYPLPGQNLTSASITVVTEDFVLLHNFSFDTYKGSYLFKEYAVNVTSNSLLVTFIPTNGSVAFVNAIEVVSVPDSLIPDQASVAPYGQFDGLSGLALETIYRLNMGGPLITAQNDTLRRTWENDGKYLHVNSSASNVSVNPLNIKYGDAVAPEIAPNYVYATAETMGDASVSNVNFNITWVLQVDPSFSYFLRVHFCDIVSKSLNSLIFNLYINTDIAVGSLDLSNKAGNLDVPYYTDFVSKVPEGSDTLTVSVGPDINADFPNAILNGLEVMKISNEAKSLTGSLPVDTLLVLPPKKHKTGVIIGSVVGAVVTLILCGLCCFCLVARRSKEANQGSSWLPLPMYGNSLTMTKMSTLSQKSGTASCISLALNPVLPREQVNIAEWAMTWQKKGMLDHIMDKNLVGKVNTASLKKFGETAEKCLAEHGVDRPSMGDVLWNLEYALQLEETTSALMEPDDNSTNHIPGISLTPLEPFDNSVNMIDGVNSGTDDDAEDAASSAVFSQLVNPRGRFPLDQSAVALKPSNRLKLTIPSALGLGFRGLWSALLPILIPNLVMELQGEGCLLPSLEIRPWCDKYELAEGENSRTDCNWMVGWIMRVTNVGLGKRNSFHSGTSNMKLSGQARTKLDASELVSFIRGSCPRLLEVLTAPAVEVEDIVVCSNVVATWRRV